MGKFFKELDVPFETIRYQILEHILACEPDIIHKSTYTFGDVDAFRANCPSIKWIFDALAKKQNLNYWDNLSYVGICVLQPGATLRPHIDCSPSMVGVNIPLMNCEGTYTQFYRGWASAQWEIRSGVNGISVTSEEVLEEFQLTKPTLFLPKVPHGVINPKDTVRLMVSLRFTEDPLDLFFK
jgi:hypothetical protein